MKNYLFILLCLVLLISCQKKQKAEENNVLKEEMPSKNELENKSSVAPVYRDLPFHKVYQFDPGYYYMLDYPVRIRAQLNLQGEVIGTLGMNSKIKIISTADVSALEINDVGALWYKIEYENITGYIWGGYISAKTLVYDIDKNGVDDYFHYRVSRIQGPHFYYVNPQDDVVIYLNNKIISTTDIFGICGECWFETTERNTVLIILYFGGEGGVWKNTFEMDATGKIVLIEQIHEKHGYGDE
jgi:hypothetical protein